MRYRVVVALLLTFGLGYCLVQGYKVEPKTAALNCPRFGGHFFRRHLLVLRTRLG
jgi:hypothetical protein